MRGAIPATIPTATATATATTAAATTTATASATRLAALAVGAIAFAAGAGPAGADPYRWPVASGPPVTAHFDHGNVTDWMCGNRTYSGHKGTDIGVPRQTAVFAADAGWVKHRTDGYGDGYIGSTDGGGFGNAVAVFHGDGDETIYAHLTAGSGLPALGASVTCSERIGGSGTSGNSSGPHLHFETRTGVSETGSYYSGAAEDPFTGPCSGPVSAWVDQNNGAPVTTCAGPPAPIDDAAFVADVTIPDGTEVVAGTPFVKTWRLRNSGTSTWGGGYTLDHTDGPDFGGAPVAVAAGPGEEVDVTVVLTASGSGTQRSTWRMSHDGVGFGQAVWVEVTVVASPSSDGDGDGFGPGQDCDDGDPTVHPGAEEACDGVDSDCDGRSDDGLTRVCCDTGMATCSAGAWGACSVTCADDGGDGSAAGGCDAAPGSRGGSGWAVMLGLGLAAALGRRRRRAVRATGTGQGRS